MQTKLADAGIFTQSQQNALSRRGIKTIQDLLYYFPRRYIDKTNIVNPNVVQSGETVAFLGRVIHAETKYSRRRRLVVRVKPENGFPISLVFFQGIQYIAKVLKPGFQGAFFGKVEVFRGEVNMVHPEYEELSGDELVHIGKIVPVYRITDGMKKAYLTSRVLREAVFKLLEKFAHKINDPIQPSFLQKNDLLPLNEALKKIHFPQDLNEVEQARRRLAFNELLTFQILMQIQKEKRMQVSVPKQFPKTKKNYAQEMIQALPFDLTSDQKKAIEKLHKLAEKPYPFGALLQGDVGSGKTLVALITALKYIEAGYQTALMAPTEILARQHYRTFLNFLNHIAFEGIDLLVGQERKKERDAKLDRLKRGDTKLIVGTHALIQKDVEFRNLAFLVIDEQHRFGVEQREALRAKGNHPDFLAMTATPIPRSLALTYYGDLETIVIREKPPGRKKVDTRLFDESMLNAIYKGVKKYVSQGRQAYIVYPVIDESSMDKTGLASVLADYKHLENNVFPQFRLGLLHGRLSAEEKESAMRKFKEGTIQILVTTTVIEVGVDVPNATVMVIRNAERFGLSQLHQLRGRVGRGEHQSFCILVSSSKITDEGKERLKAMVESDDGFYLAQEDLRIRGTGELLGTKQAGISEFKLADLRRDQDLAYMAFEYVQQFPQSIKAIRSMKGFRGKIENVLKKGYIGV